MASTVRIALIGDYDPDVVAHQAIPQALTLASARGGACEWEWLHTAALIDADAQLAGYHGIWCVPASPYANTAGALSAIRYARERGRPFLGTCGGFQHALLEYAHGVWGVTDAAHAETDPDAADPVIAPLACSLVGATGTIHFEPASRMRAIYGADSAIEGYHCSYGLSAAYAERLTDGPLHVSARDDAGDVRGVELTSHPFFMATLFQPERAALTGRTPPLVQAFVDACR